MEEHKKSKLRSFWEGIQPKDRSLLKKLFLCLVAGCILMLWSGGQQTQTQPYSPAAAPAPAAEAQEADLQQQLTAILSQIKGAGQVQVAVYYSESRESVYALEHEVAESESQESGADSRSKNQTETLAVLADGPVLVKSYEPKIQGVVVVAEGAGDPLVAERLYQAVKRLLGLSSAQIAVLEGKGGTDDALDVAEK